MNAFAQGVKEHIELVQSYFLPILVKTELDGHFRIGEEIHTVQEVKEWKDWTKTEHRIRKAKSGMLFELYLRENPRRSILLQLGVRKKKNTLNEQIKDYPRFHSPSDLLTKEDTYDFLRIHQIGFCVLLLDLFDHPILYWADFFSSQPITAWNFVERKKGRRKDRFCAFPDTVISQVNRVGTHNKNLIEQFKKMIKEKYEKNRITGCVGKSETRACE